MSKLFRRHSNILCFFCQTSVSPLPQNLRNFKCPTCGCWNRYNASGEILSDEPAMHDEQLNKQSFARRASPRKDRFPTSYGPGPFCHTCQTNQMLVLNLLSSYLPPPESAEYVPRLELLPQYRESLHTRYPPVCDQCMPVVEEEIRKKDQMARTKALGGWLKDSKGKEKQRRVSGNSKEREKSSSEMFWWKTRGYLWGATLGASTLFNICAIFDLRPFYFLGFLQPVFPLLVLSSILWAVWDPTYSSFRKAQRQGRDVRVQGKKEYIIFQMIAWATRLSTSILLWLSWYNSNRDYLKRGDSSSNLSRIYFSTVTTIEVTAQVLSFWQLRLKHPPAVRLIDTQTHRFTPSRSSTPYPSSGSRGTTPAVQPPQTGAGRQSSLQPASEPDLLAALSLSSKPIIAPKNPVFGLPSLISNSLPAKEDEEQEDGDDDNIDDDNAMDWTPTDPRAARRRKDRTKVKTNENVWLRPQRFFAPEKPTGLEGLFARTRLDDDAMMVDSEGNPSRGSIRTRVVLHLQVWRWVYAMVVVPVLVAVVAGRVGYWNIFTTRLGTRFAQFMMPVGGPIGPTAGVVPEDVVGETGS